MITKRTIVNMTKRLGISLEMNNPDGRMRYNFFEPYEVGEPASLGREIGFAIGSREAWLFLRGFGAGLARGKKAYFALKNEKSRFA